MRLAYQLAVRNGIKNQFYKRNENAGRKWLKNFLRRHPQISARGFTPASVANFLKSTNLQWTPLNIMRQDLIIAMRPASLLYTQTNENIRIERRAPDVFSSIRRTGISCDSRHLNESKWTLHSPVTCISKKIYETGTDEWRTAWINRRVQFRGVDTERDFHPAVSSFHQAYKTKKKK